MHRTPPFSTDPSRFGAYIPFKLGLHSSRLFLPFFDIDNNADPLSWTELAAHSGEALRADTVLYDLLDEDRARAIHPSATVQDPWATLLLSVLSSTVPIEDDFIFARSVVYAETTQRYAKIVDQRLRCFSRPRRDLIDAHIGPWNTKDFAVTLEPLVSLREESTFPTYIWSEDLSLVLTCPIYSDSVFLTSSTLCAEDFTNAGLEAQAIVEDNALPITGD